MVTDRQSADEKGTAQFVVQLTESQNRLYAFILVLLPDPHAARDVLQETNLVMWERAGDFCAEKSFWAWASGIARMKVLSYYRDHKRDRLVFDDDLVESLALAANQVAQEDDFRSSNLRACLDQLPAEKRNLLASRYVSRLSVNALARQAGRSSAAVSMTLYRLREVLLNCVQRKHAEEQNR